MSYTFDPLAGSIGNNVRLSGGKVPTEYLPSYVDDVVEYASLAVFPATGETGKIYLALDADTIYRWSGSQYVLIGSNTLSQQTLTYQTASLAAGASEEFTINAGSIYVLTSITASTPSWIRVYGTATARTADTRTEAGGTFPSPGSEFYAEVTTDTTPETIRMAPVPTVLGTSGLSYLKVTNLDTVARVIDLSIAVTGMAD